MQAWHKVIVDPMRFGYTRGFVTAFLERELRKLEDNGCRITGQWQAIYDPFKPGEVQQYRIRVDIPDPSFMLLP